MIAGRLGASISLAGIVVLASSMVVYSRPLDIEGSPPFKAEDCPRYCARVSPNDVEKCTGRCVRHVKRMRASWPDRCWNLCPSNRR